MMLPLPALAAEAGVFASRYISEKFMMLPTYAQDWPAMSSVCLTAAAMVQCNGLTSSVPST